MYYRVTHVVLYCVIWQTLLGYIYIISMLIDYNEKITTLYPMTSNLLKKAAATGDQGDSNSNTPPEAPLCDQLQLRVHVGWRGAASWPWLCYALWQLPFRESVWGYPMSPVSVSDIPEDFRHLVWWRSEDVCRCEFLKVPGGHPLQPVGVGDAPESLRGIGEDLKQPHENAGYSVHVPSHFDFPGVPDLVIVYLRHPGFSCKPSEPFHVHEEVLNQPCENASYPPVSIIHNHPAGCMSRFNGAKRGVSGRTKATRAWFVKGVGMSMMPFGDGTGGAVSGDSSTPCKCIIMPMTTSILLTLGPWRIYGHSYLSRLLLQDVNCELLRELYEMYC
ncbi:hypothetical protein F5141DRAFT_1065918 [Pisolithus sp. B1]|nr:hypothetical protein F5141DRAFT_1065918 [Pisolithus sp. B1]